MSDGLNVRLVIACKNGCRKAFSSRLAPAGEPVIEGVFSTHARMNLTLEYGEYIATNRT